MQVSCLSDLERSRLWDLLLKDGLDETMSRCQGALVEDSIDAGVCMTVDFYLSAVCAQLESLKADFRNPVKAKKVVRFPVDLFSHSGSLMTSLFYRVLCVLRKRKNKLTWLSRWKCLGASSRMSLVMRNSERRDVRRNQKAKSGRKGIEPYVYLI